MTSGNHQFIKVASDYVDCPVVLIESVQSLHRSCAVSRTPWPNTTLLRGISELHGFIFQLRGDSEHMITVEEPSIPVRMLVSIRYAESYVKYLLIYSLGT